MALIACPDCAREVSDAAPSCPGCGRPIAAAPPPAPPAWQPSPQWQANLASPSGASHKARGGISIRRIISAVVLVVLLVVVYVVAQAVEPLRASCIMNGFGVGHCTFTNRGFVPGRMCGSVVLDGPGSSASSPVFCSGFVWPGSSTDLGFDVVEANRLCTPSQTMFELGQKWNDVCSFAFKEAR